MAEHKNQVQQDTDDFEKQLMFAAAVGAGQGATEAIMRRAVEEYTRQQAIIADLQARLRGLSEVAPGIARIQDDNGAINEQTMCLVEARVWLRYGTEPEQMDVLIVEPGFFFGSRQAAQQIIARDLLAAMQRIPTLEDIDKQKLDGITTDELMFILKELTPYKFVFKKDYEAARLRLFDQFYPQMQAAQSSGTEAGARQKRKKHFFNAIERCFEHAAKRYDVKKTTPLLTAANQTKT